MPLTGDSTILVPVDVSATEPPDQVILELLRPVNIVVLGYYPVPKQTAPAHLKEDHEAEAAERLENIVSKFTRADQTLRMSSCLRKIGGTPSTGSRISTIAMLCLFPERRIPSSKFSSPYEEM